MSFPAFKPTLSSAVPIFIQQKPNQTKSKFGTLPAKVFSSGDGHIICECGAKTRSESSKLLIYHGA
jgi:hypothetical protein